MCKSSSLIFVLFFAFLFKLEKFSYHLVGVILIIVVGVVMMVATETRFDPTGFILVMSGSALGGLRWSLTQLLLKEEKVGVNNPAATVFWFAPIMGVTLASISLIVDGWLTILSSKFFESASQILYTTFFLLAPGTIAFMMVMSEY
jgi:solute carrier family 35 protein C2